MELNTQTLQKGYTKDSVTGTITIEIEVINLKSKDE